MWRGVHPMQLHSHASSSSLGLGVVESGEGVVRGGGHGGGSSSAVWLMMTRWVRVRRVSKRRWW